MEEGEKIGSETTSKNGIKIARMSHMPTKQRSIDQSMSLIVINRPCGFFFFLFSCSVEKPLPLAGPLEVNNLLDNAQRLFEGQLHGAETLLRRDNEIFASVLGGEIVKITGNHITHVAKIGQPCGMLNMI